MGPGWDARKQKLKSFHLSWAKPFAPGPQKAVAAKISSSCLFGCQSSYLCHQHRKRGAENQGPLTRLCLAARVWPSPAPGYARHAELGTFSSGNKAEAGGRRVVLTAVYSGQKGKFDFIQSTQKMQGATGRGEENLYPLSFIQKPFL